MDFAKIFSFWANLSDSQRSALEKSARTEKYDSGYLIHRTDGNCKGIIAVLSGILRVYCVSDEGREVTLYRVQVGEVCILSASCLMDSIVFDVIIEAVGERKRNKKNLYLEEKVIIILLLILHYHNEIISLYALSSL